jgi:hypothetical protein
MMIPMEAMAPATGKNAGLIAMFAEPARQIDLIVADEGQNRAGSE